MMMTGSRARSGRCWRKTVKRSRISPTCEAFLEAFRPGREGCLVVDAYLPGMTGLTLLRRLHDSGRRLPAIMITGNSDVTMAVEAMKAGALDFIEKPISRPNLLASVDRALEQAHDTSKLSAWREDAASHMARPDGATTADHGDGAGRASQQEYRGRSGHQPAHGGKSPGLDHAENGDEVAAGAGPAGSRGGRRLVLTGAV